MEQNYFIDRKILNFGVSDFPDDFTSSASTDEAKARLIALIPELKLRANRKILNFEMSDFLAGPLVLTTSVRRG